MPLNPAWSSLLLQVEQDGPEVEAEEGVRGVGYVIEFLYLEVEGGEFKETMVLPGQKLKTKRKPMTHPKTFTETLGSI